MKVSLGWLAEWIDLPDSVDELGERLTVGGLEIESVERTGPDLSAVRVGHVVERRAHPDADRLSLCSVDLGEGEPVDIVCGAPNVDTGQKVAVATPGAVLPGGLKIKKSKIRGVASHGMICSLSELGLGDDHDGILVLDAAAPVGVGLDQVLPAGDTVLDFEITPNRGDWVSMLGMAREVRAHFGGSVRLPDHDVAEDARDAAADIDVQISDGAGCYRYVARIARGVRVGPSPEWLVRKLEAAGLRSINVVVDITNLVLLEFGQPLHAFDLHKLRGAQVHVRAAREGEKIVTLDGQTRELSPADLVIADAERAIAIAGVMGGAETEVRDDTTDILIESAHFSPSRVRRTARRLGLHSDASYRFERGVDHASVARAADRCARLLADLAGAKISTGRVEALGEAFDHCDEVKLHPARVDRLLGTNLSAEEVTALLARVDIRAEMGADGKLTCAIPSYRNDVSIAEDLIEEVARIYGYDRIETTLPAAQLAPVARPRELVLASAARDSLAASGLLETRTFPSMRPQDFDALRLPEDSELRRRPRLRNPIHEGEAELRSTAIASLLRATRHNLDRQVECVRLFEVARVFLAAKSGELPDEKNVAAAVLTRGERNSLWDASEPPPIFFEAKGVLERLIADLGFPARVVAEEPSPWLHPGAACALAVGKAVIARVGEVHPEVAQSYGIDVPCAVLELDLGALQEVTPRPARFRDVSPYPAVRRDIAVIVDRQAPAGEMLDAVRKTAGSHLAAASLFDRYEGKGIPEGRVSLAFRMVFQRADRTLTDVEVTKSSERVVEMLTSRFGAEQR